MENIQEQSNNSSYVNLWYEVIDRALKDLKHKDDLIRVSAESWLSEKNGGFEWVCDHVGVEADSIRKKVLGV